MMDTPAMETGSVSRTMEHATARKPLLGLSVPARSAVPLEHALVLKPAIRQWAGWGARLLNQKRKTVTVQTMTAMASSMMVFQIQRSLCEEKCVRRVRGICGVLRSRRMGLSCGYPGSGNL